MNWFKKFLLKIKNSDFYQTFKEEMVAVPLLLLAFYLFNWLMIALFPQGAFFDFYSQIETIVSKIFLYIVTLCTAHLALMVSFPKIYKYLHDKIYHNFENIPEEKKLDFTIKFVLAFILAAALVFGA